TGSQEERDEARKNVERMVRELAITYHRDAIKLKNAEVYSLAADLYKAYQDAFGTLPGQTGEMKFYLAELMYSLHRWDEAAVAYLDVAKANPQGPLAEKGIYAAIVS